MSAAQKVDWSKVEPHYRAGLRSLRDLGAEHGVSDAAIIKHAKKNGWSRDLKAKIAAAADAKVSAAMVSAEVSAETKLTEAVRVEVEAEVQARIRLTHRSDIGKYRAMGMHLMQELDAMGDDEKIPVRAKVFKDLTDTLARLVDMESKAFGLEGAPPPAPAGETADPLDVARRLAFLMAAGVHAQPRTVQ